MEKIPGFEINSREIQLFIDNKLICVFKEMYSKDFKTEWFNQSQIFWDGSDGFLESFIILDGIKTELSGFIPSMPSMDVPTLWSQFENKTWRLIKGSGSVDKTSHMLMPTDWTADKKYEVISILNNQMKWVAFQGEITIYKNDKKERF